jgi:methylmalonyl-CoA mutase N-terminal domain/subunit
VPDSAPSPVPLGRRRSGLAVLPVYSAADLAATGFEPDEDLGAPGAWPYTRAPVADLYRDQPWIMGQYSGFATPQETNARFRRLLSEGQTGFSIALDLPTQMGLDSDHPLATGEVGKVGVPLDSLRDMEVVLDGIDLAQVRQIRTSANSIGPIVQAMFIAAAENQGTEPNAVRVMLQNDSLKEYVARGTYIFPPEYGLKFSVDVMEYAAEHLPRWEPIEFCGYHIRDSGCNAVQEVTIAVANAVAYLDELARRGASLEACLASSVFFLSADVNFLEEAAKFRATRRLWARLVEQRYGVSHAAGKGVSIFCYTLGGSLSSREPLNNVVRVAYEALGAALGGVQTLASSSYDEALGLPTEQAVLLSLRTQQILAFETGVIDTVDPLAGSYYVEAQTTAFEKAVLAELSTIDSAGGAVACIRDGRFQGVISEAAYETQLDVESGRRPLIGVNRFANDTAQAAAFKVFSGSQDAEQRQRQALQQLKADRDQVAVDAALADVRNRAVDGGNTVEPILGAVRAYATVGEICSVLRGVWGSYTSSAVAI